MKSKLCSGGTGLVWRNPGRQRCGFKRVFGVVEGELCSQYRLVGLNRANSCFMSFCFPQGLSLLVSLLSEEQVCVL